MSIHYHTEEERLVAEQAIAANESGAVFTLPAGQGRLVAWFVPTGKTRQRITDNSDRGDVILRREE